MAAAKKSSPNGKQKSPKGKGKAAAAVPPSPPAKVSSPPPAEVEAEDNDLLELAESITAKAHLLAPGLTDAELAQKAQDVVKASFDRALASENISFPHLQSLLKSLNPSSGPSTRSSSRSDPTPSDEPSLSLQKTPLEELTTEGMDPEMIWEQMEMRSGVVVELLDEMFGGAEEEEGSGDEGEIEGEDDEDEEMMEGEDDWGAMMGEGSEDEDDEDEESDENEGEEIPFEEEEPHFRKLGGPEGMNFDDEPEEEDPQADATKDLSIDSFDKPGSGRPSRRAPGPASAVDDTFFSLHDFHQQTDEGEFEMAKALRGEVDEDDDDEAAGEDDFDLFAPVDLGMDEDGEEDLDNADIMYKDFFEPPPRPLPKDKKDKKGKGRVPSSEEVATPAKKEKAPSAIGTPATADTPSGKRGVRFSEAVKVKLIAPRGSEFDKLVNKVGWEQAEEIFRQREAEQAAAGGEEEEEDEELEEGLPMEDEDDEDEEDVEMEDGEEEGSEEGDEEEGEFESEEDDVDEGQETIERLKSSLFDEDDEEADDGATPAQQLSRQERRLLALSSQIAALEAENVGTKNWATKGEAKAKDRPTNSLLDEDLEYERTGKVVPVITEETTKTIEDLIKKRILDNQFDDVVRQRAVDPNAFLPSRFMELQDSKSNKSLAEIYEEDFQTAKDKEEGRTVTHELDKELEDKHAEIEELFDELSGKLDALSNARFTPKPPKATISTITNLPTITMESALPTTTSAGTMLAPEEVFVPDPTNEDRSEFTPSQKKQARQKRRKQRAAMAKSADKFVKGVKGEKERATKELVGTKGVTVIGKGGKAIEGGKGVKRKRGDDAPVSSGVGLKL